LPDFQRKLEIIPASLAEESIEAVGESGQEWRGNFVTGKKGDYEGQNTRHPSIGGNLLGIAANDLIFAHTTGRVEPEFQILVTPFIAFTGGEDFDRQFGGGGQMARRI
jgi:hypothetical protein